MATATAKKEVETEISAFKAEKRLRQIQDHFSGLFKVSGKMVRVCFLYNSTVSQLSRYRVSCYESVDAQFSADYRMVRSYFVIIKDPPYSDSNSDILRRMSAAPVLVVSTSPKLPS